MQNPVRHGADAIMSIIKVVVEEKPLVMLGTFGILRLIAGVIFGVWILQI